MVGGEGAVGPDLVAEGDALQEDGGGGAVDDRLALRAQEGGGGRGMGGGAAAAGEGGEEGKEGEVADHDVVAVLELQARG